MKQYPRRDVEAAHRVLIDLGQVLGSHRDSFVIVGGWVPDLLISSAQVPHSGSIDVDLALDARKLEKGAYADLIEQLLATGRYKKGKKEFQLFQEVDLQDEMPPVSVDVDFLAPSDIRLNGRKLLPEFRVLQADGCEFAFDEPSEIAVEGVSPSGAINKVYLRVTALHSFLIMKAFALAGRDNPKDAYDIVYCLENAPSGIKNLAAAWDHNDQKTAEAIKILQEKFGRVDAFGPSQVVQFYPPSSIEEAQRVARNSYELVQAFLAMCRHQED